MKNRKPFSPSENHSYNVNASILLKHPGKAVILKEMYRSHIYFRDHHGKQVDGFSWFFLKMSALEKSYPEYNVKTMYRWIKDFEDSNLIASRSDLNAHNYDRTKWFTVNTFAYESLCLGKGFDWLNSQSENGENSEHSNWVNEILKMRIAESQNENSCSQDDLTIQPRLNPSLNPSLEPCVESSDSPTLFENVVFSYSLVNSENVTSEEEKICDKKEEAARAKAKMTEDAISAIVKINEFAGRKLPTDPTGRGSANVEKALSLLKKKYTLEELELVVEYKCWEWMGTNSQKYLRPATLFGNKFQIYLQDAEEAKDNPSFLSAVKRAKDAESGTKHNSFLNVADSYTHQAASNLKNW